MSKSNTKPKESSFNKKMIVVIIIPVILLISFIAIASNPMIPDTMDLDVKGLDGSSFLTKNYEGKIQIIEFMATWCTVCEQITNNVGNLLRNGEISSDVLFWSVSIDPTHDTPDVLSAYMDAHNVTSFANDGKWIFARDVDKNALYYQATTVPHTFLVDRDLKIVKNQLGLLTESDILNWISLIK